MPSLARRHHFLPQGYLAGFTESGEKDGWLHVLDMHLGRSFRTSPLNVAVEKDFKRIDLDGHPPDAIEVALAPLESRAIQAIRRTVDTRQFPGPEDHNLILNLISLLLAQNPKSRRLLNKNRTALADAKLKFLVSSRDVWEHHVKLARAAGESLPSDVKYERALRFVTERRYTVQFSTDGTLRAEFDAQDRVLAKLGKRRWTLLLTPESGPLFITCDYPFSLAMAPGVRGTPSLDGSDTEFLFPLSKTAAFLGIHEPTLPPVLNISAKAIAIMNGRTLRRADRRLFLAQRRFNAFIDGRFRELQA